MQDLVTSLQSNAKKLRKAIDKRYQVSVNRAKAEYTYRSELGKAMAEAKVEGMAATSLYDYCRGYEYIAKLRSERDILVAQEDYLTEMIYYYRTEIRIAENQMKAETQNGRS